MKNRCLIAVPLLVALALPAVARLGESQEESKARYGSPVKPYFKEEPLLPGAREWDYFYQGWRLRAAFVKDEACRMQYMKIRDKETRKTPPIAPEEVEAILEAEKHGGEWEVTRSKATRHLVGFLQESFGKEPAAGITWTNSNGATAVLSAGDRVLTLESPVAQAWRDYRAKKQGVSKDGQDIPSF